METKAMFIVVIAMMILSTLFVSLFYVLTTNNNTKRVVKLLTFRVVLSISLFVMVLFAYFKGWIVLSSPF